MKTEPVALETEINQLDALPAHKDMSVDTTLALLTAKNLALEPAVRDSFQIRNLLLNFFNWYLSKTNGEKDKYNDFNSLTELKAGNLKIKQGVDVIELIDNINSFEGSTQVFTHLITLVYSSGMEETLKLAVVRRMISYTNGEMVHAMLPDSMKVHLNSAEVSGYERLTLEGKIEFTRDKTVEALKQKIDTLLETEETTQEQRKFIKELMMN